MFVPKVRVSPFGCLPWRHAEPVTRFHFSAVADDRLYCNLYPVNPYDFNTWSSYAFLTSNIPSYFSVHNLMSQIIPSRLSSPMYSFYMFHVLLLDVGVSQCICIIYFNVVFLVSTKGMLCRCSLRQSGSSEALQIAAKVSRAQQFSGEDFCFAKGSWCCFDLHQTL